VRLLVDILLTVNSQFDSSNQKGNTNPGIAFSHWQILRVSTDLERLWELFWKKRKKKGKLLNNRIKNSHNSVQV